MTDNVWLENLNNLLYILRILFISIFSWFTSKKILNIKMSLNLCKKILVVTGLIFTAFITGIIKININFSSSIISIVFLLSLIFSAITKNDYGNSVLVTIISISINYIIYFLSTIISFIPHKILGIQNEYINFAVIICIYSIIMKKFLNIYRIKNGFQFLKKNKNNQYLNLLILNICVIVLYTIVAITTNKNDRVINMSFRLIILSIIMFITIQKSLQIYYKQKLLIQDLTETKKELEEKKKEIEKLEKENLNFSKISHSIAHKQKSLEYKLEQLAMNSEIANEIEIKDRINNITKDFQKETALELSKTGIEEIDDMLKYMQSECIKNKIDFQLQINGNIHKMINNHIEKESLEILLADHIKNAIIAIGSGDNINKSILVRLGIIDGNYGVYIYDSGIEFEIKTLLNLGRKPATTHKDTGGTGMGFMNTFDTLRKYKASLEICEYGKPCKDNFTKVLKIKFDKKTEFNILSYRAAEIEKLDKQNLIKVEKLI